MILEFLRQVTPERGCLGPVFLVGPQAAVELLVVVLGPAHARQRQRRDHHFEPGLVGAVEHVLQRLHVGGDEPFILVGSADEEIALLRLPLVIGQPHPGGAITAQRIEIGLIRRQPVEAVAAMLRLVPEADEIGSLGMRNGGGKRQGEDQ